MSPRHPRSPAAPWHGPATGRRRALGFGLALTAGLALASTAPSVLAATWPEGPVQLVVPAKAGGGTDAAARVIASTLQKSLGVPFVVVNQPAGGGSVAAETVRTAAPDGRTLLFFHSGLLVSHHTGLYPHSPLTAFGVGAVLPVGGSYSLAVGASAPHKSIGELVEATKAQPDKITLGVQLKSATHFMAGLLTKDSGAKFRIVEAGSDADKLVALQGGSIQAALINTPGALQYVKAGKLRILATVSGDPARDPGAADLPSMAESGYPNVVYGLDFLILAAKDTPQGHLEAVNQAFAKVLANESVAAQFAKMRMPLRHLDPAAGRARLAEVDDKTLTTARALGLR